jgi:Kef-type K+ transport system membrane component KefB
VDATQVAAVLAATVGLASIISVELGLLVALIELGLGVVVGNLFNVDPNTDWLVFIATFASIVLTFLREGRLELTDSLPAPSRVPLSE